MLVGIGPKVLVSVAREPLKTRMEVLSWGSGGGRAQPRRRQHGFGEAESGDPVRDGQAARERRAGLAHRGGGLDAVAALRGHPEEARGGGIETAHQVAVRNEGA